MSGYSSYIREKGLAPESGHSRAQVLEGKNFSDKIAVKETE